jgi:dTDP-glucose pyrophosphorylase
VQAVILAGGMGSRLGDLSKDGPKSLTPLYYGAFSEYRPKPQEEDQPPHGNQD